jgi:hypothetical protein
MPQAMDSIEFTALNGEKVRAPLWIWMTALVETLSVEKKNEMLERIKHIGQEAQQKRIVQPRHYVMHAEPGVFSTK